MKSIAVSRSVAFRQGVAAEPGARLRRSAHLALYVAAATVLFVLERSIPNPLPWVRLGLANGVTLLVLFRHGAAAALWVQGCRILLGSLFAGTFLGPAFLLALGGGLASGLVMVGARSALARWLSLLGISVLGAVFHVVAQLILVAIVFQAGGGVFALLPFFLGTALVTGAAIGVVVQVLLERLAVFAPPAGP